MGRIFMDFEIINLKVDREAPGIFLKAKKPKNYVTTDLSDIAFYFMVLNRRTKEISSIKDIPLIKRIAFKFLSSKAKWLLPGSCKLIAKKGAKTIIKPKKNSLMKAKGCWP